MKTVVKMFLGTREELINPPEKHAGTASGVGMSLHLNIVQSYTRVLTIVSTVTHQ